MPYRSVCAVNLSGTSRRAVLDENATEEPSPSTWYSSKLFKVDNDRQSMANPSVVTVGRTMARPISKAIPNG
ncbi:hypothetical protein HYQ46_000032 [Verticillium longisporum]|nr:hypothetical protein HYQ46_000032 [Verticillium longisporum]